MKNFLLQQKFFGMQKFFLHCIICIAKHIRKARAKIKNASDFKNQLQFYDFEANDENHDFGAKTENRARFWDFGAQKVSLVFSN